MTTTKKKVTKKAAKKKRTKKKKVSNAGRPQSEIKTERSQAARIAANVRRLRKKKFPRSKGGVAAAARAAGISQETWYRIERADVRYKTPWRTLCKVAAALGVKRTYDLEKSDD